jgi:hypothetical protein
MQKVVLPRPSYLLLIPAPELCARCGLSGDELKAEQGIILAQLAFVKQLKANKAEASKLISDIQSQTYLIQMSFLINIGALMLSQEPSQ